MNPCPEILREMSLRGIPVILGADAHSPDRVAGDFLEEINLLEQAGYGELHVCLKKNRTSVSLEAARRKLQQPASV